VLDANGWPRALREDPLELKVRLAARHAAISAGELPYTPSAGDPLPEPELPEVERARASIAAQALGRGIVAVDDTGGYCCRPHGRGEMAETLTGHELTSALRGKVIPARRHGGRCPRCGAEVARATVGGRTTWWCPADQA